MTRTLKEFRGNFKCGKAVFVKLLPDGKSETVYFRCGRRTCPRCRSYYAGKRGAAFEKLYGSDCCHVVLTLSDEYVRSFPDEIDYCVSKDFTRVNQARRNEGKRVYEFDEWDYTRRDLEVEGICRPPESLVSIRSRIHKASKRINDFIREVRESVPQLGDMCKGYIRSIEFGEKGTKRWHCHIVFPVSWSSFKNAKWSSISKKIHYHKGEKIVRYVCSHGRWKYGDIRVTPISGGNAAILYVSSYMSKNAPGRVTNSREMSRFLKEIKSSDGEVYKYVQAFEIEKLEQRKLDKIYMGLYNSLERCVHGNSNNKNFKRKYKDRSKRELKRAFNRGYRVIDECSTGYSTTDREYTSVGDVG